MKLSIIVTTWGVEPWVGGCLDSVRRAAEGQDVEVLEICNGTGAAAARNEGLAKATGDYVWFVDGDDFVSPDAIVRIAAAVKAHPGVDIVHFRLADVGDGRSLPPSGSQVVGAFFDLRRRAGLTEAYRHHARWLLGSSAVYRRELVKDMRFEPLVKGEDSLWGRRAFYAAASLVYLDTELYGYRRRPTGADQTRDRRHYDDARRAGWEMMVEGLKVPGIRFRVFLDWLRLRFRELPKWYNG